MRKGILLLSIVLLLSLAAVPPAQAAEPTFTLMIYLCGTDLESDQGSAADDILELIEANIDADGPVRVLVETGGTREWWLENIDPTMSERWLLDGDTMYCIESVRRRDMGDAATLQDFVAYGVRTFPADRYGLILWNHGMGSTGGVCYDEYTGNCLTNEDIHTALSGVRAGSPDFQLAFIGFDACLMATYELASYVSDFADYMLASEELVPGSGLAYATPLMALRANPAMDTEALCRAFVDAFFTETLALDPDDYITLSVLNLAHMPALSDALEQVAAGLAGALDAGDLRTISRGRQTMRSFGSFDDADSDMVDLRQFIGLFADVSGADAAALQCALDDVVVYNRYTEDKISHAGGLSILLPLGTREYYDAYAPQYDPLGLFPQYHAFLDDYTARLNGGSYAFAATTPQTTSGWQLLSDLGDNVTIGGWGSASTDGAQSGWTAVESDGDAAPAPAHGGWTSLTDLIDQIDEAGPADADDFGEGGVFAYSLALTEEDIEHLAYVEGNLMLDVSDEDIDAYVDLGYLQHTLIDWEHRTVYSLFDGAWPVLEGQLVHMIDQTVTQWSRRSLIDVTVNGEEVYLLVVFDENRPQGEIIGYTEGYGENGLPARGYSKLSPGDVIIPNYYLYTYDEDGNEEIEAFEGDPIYYDGTLAFGYESLEGEGLEYAYCFCLNDIFGDYSFSDFVFFTL